MVDQTWECPEQMFFEGKLEKKGVHIKRILKKVIFLL